MSKVAVWQLLWERERITKEEAERLILAGKVRVGDEVVRQVGAQVDPGAPVHVARAPRFASRGGDKLAFALAALHIEVGGLVALDAGASAGGFTDCLLQHGARLVYAVDAGFGQLVGRLRADRRVINYERTNLGDPQLAQLHPRPSLVTLDLSYLSLRIAVPIAARLVGERGEIVALIKPLFETRDRLAQRTGELTEAQSAAAAEQLAADLRGSGFPVGGPIRSPIGGRRGTIEFFAVVGIGTPLEGASR